jgi:hypothetical protein
MRVAASIGMLRAIACVVAMGCTSPSVLRVEPAQIDLDVELHEPAPSVGLRVFRDDTDVTGRATFALAGAPVATIAEARLVSDGYTGGAATLTVSVDADTASIPVTATIHETRLVAGTSNVVPSWFTSTQDALVSQPLEPSDGAVVPPDLGALDVEFGADDADNIHEVVVTAPYLDLRVYAMGAPGPRQVSLDGDEWRAIASTARGASIALAVRSTQAGGGATVHATSATVDIADLDASELVFGGAPTDASGAIAGRPQLYRYDMHRAAVAPFAQAPADGSGCIGCHIAVSPDGKRIAGAGMVAAGGAIVGMIIDTSTRGLVVADTSPWNTGTYDPSGLLVTSNTATGELILRDGTTAAPIATLALGEPAAGPTISLDGRFLAYAQMTAPEGGNPAGPALRVRPWDAATATVGAPITVVADAGVLAPEFSSDGAWLLYTRSTEPSERGIVGGAVVRADGSAPPIPLTTGAGDQIPRWASAIASSHAGGRDAEPMAWVAFASSRAVGPRPGTTKSLWLAPFYPDRGAFGPAVHLPGQPRDLFALHAPYALP